MDRPRIEGIEGLEVEPMNEELAAILRKVTTHFELHKCCPFKVCKRAGACATRHVICFQACRDVLGPIIRQSIDKYSGRNPRYDPDARQKPLPEIVIRRPSKARAR